ncbi:anti-H(O) lectin 1-like [Eucalyptus grandis]|uniref:anti-H(O) lectin 1-like n=1 Tax=Eucalyptus grandis TaxID=71139 RepID=UPI000527587D|nr:anti-H(O) lectin 1-like [Eucalyptus grandis]
MANFHSSENSHSKLMIVLASITIVTCLFIPRATSAVSFSTTAFDFPSFNPNDHNISYEGDAHASKTSVQLTVNQRDKALNGSAGRATYVKPMHLWDKSTGNVADFTTQFSFAISSLGSNVYADGISFFLAPNGSQIPPFSAGGYLALVSSQSNYSDSNSDSFVAVEFDTYVNPWDPSYKHIGIDINSVNSVTTDPWNWNRIGSGGRVHATIAYDSSVQNLSVLLIDDESDGSLSINQSSLSLIINLTEYLPEWVTIGFTATTGSNFELHSLYSWNFSSSLQIESNETFNQSIVPTVNSSPKKRSKSWMWGAVGGSLSVSVAITLTIGITCIRKKGTSRSKKGTSRSKKGTNHTEEIARSPREGDRADTSRTSLGQVKLLTLPDN